MPVQKLAGIDVNCQLVMLMDRMNTNVSNRRQLKLDNYKKQEELSLERPIETAMLLSMAGVQTIVLHRWAYSPADACRGVKGIVSNLSDGMDVAQAVHERD